MNKKAIALIGASAIAFSGTAYFGGKKLLKHVNSQVLAKIDEEKPASFFQDLGWRHRSSIVLGSTKAWRYLKPSQEEDGVYNLAFFECSKQSQYDIMRCYYSHLASDGVVVFVVDPEDRVPYAKTSPIDATVIHHLVFKASGNELAGKLTKQPLRLSPVWSMKYIRDVKAKRNGLYSNSTWPSNASRVLGKSDYSYLMQAKEFLDERNIRLKVLVLSGFNSEMRDEIRKTGIEDIEFCADAKALNDAVYES